ncbi:hypothetical protein [Rodentibacter trehalosifermentans]|uniref:Uncharacterized protein n=1 Tax=Rodentibacter trehalosifermentans TaxID=1908263 RepID=A0A1V3J3B4_9PAST|nr:hypothetical protein [Rodentibacter trehalosifermentans]OOF46792.1 hypothetical protein BKK51_01615 [Rodentibacter trehalosifermentans]OOF49606.1 hypothetical protein BKK52_03580 [Rodentibacter trehalosifermentans]OOF53384.1 hypothetical protein BKK53_01425 [Rodentibacter trehalosifermentans]
MKIKERELANLSQIRKENEEIIKKNNDLVNRNRYLSSELNKLANINKEIKKLEVKEEKYRECHSWILPKPKELVEQCKHDLKYVQDELSKLRQKLPY